MNIPSYVHFNFIKFIINGFIPVAFLLCISSNCFADNALVSISTTGIQGERGGSQPAINRDGNFIAFSSSSRNLFDNNDNGTEPNVFVRELSTSTTMRISFPFDPLVKVDGGSSVPSISDDGCLVAFRSSASNLVPNDTNGRSDIFVHNCQSNSIVRVSVNAMGGEAELGSSDRPSISGDGTFVAFTSGSALIAGDNNGRVDIYRSNIETGEIIRVSLGRDGEELTENSSNPAISANGRYIAFVSEARIRAPDEPADSNMRADVFVHDVIRGMTSWVSINPSGFNFGGGAILPSISALGRFVAFQGAQAFLGGNVQVYVRDLQLKTTVLTSKNMDGEESNRGAGFPSISADGNFVAFASSSNNLVPDDINDSTDVFLASREGGNISGINIAETGVGAGTLSGRSQFPDISSDAQFVAYISGSENLVLNDTNLQVDVFVNNTSVMSDPNDVDNDGVSNSLDNCPVNSNSDQADSDVDGIGNVCDNCPQVSNPEQSDSNGDGLGDVCSIGDINNDGCIERTDYILITREIRSRTTDVLFDLNMDGVINARDARLVILNYTNPRGLPCD